jgi:hypothetical protein
MEEDLKKMNGRRPQNKMEVDLKKMEEDLEKLEDNLKHNFQNQSKLAVT